MPSLLPYLDPVKTRLRIDFPRVSEDISDHVKSRFPFSVISESDPLSRLLEARLLTDAGSEIKRVFVLLQRDEYLLKGDEIWPISNTNIDEYWRKAFSSYSNGKHGGDLIILDSQINEDGTLLRLQSLFFCRTRQVFFLPPCHECGSPLEQCHDDELLISYGLQPYSTSLKRYLFCPSCFSSSGRSYFYAFSLGGADSNMVKDHWDLIKGYDRLRRGTNHMDQFPCVTCPHHGQCYGPDGLSLSRIVPFSFYPFFMLIFDTMSLSAPDFLALISGAVFEDLEGRLSEKGEAGRIRCLKRVQQDGLDKPHFLLQQDDRYFLEVLYLKLSFLQEVIGRVFSGPGFDGHPDLGLSLDRFWVKLTDHGGLLPFFWNFKVGLMEIGGNAVGSPVLSKLAPSYDLHFLGLVWFYTLLVNKKQGVSEVYEALGRLNEKSRAGDDSGAAGSPKNGVEDVLLPRNIFWDPEGKVIREDWGPLWDQAIALGRSLLKTGLYQDSGWSKDQFAKKLEHLRQEIKESLFRPRSSMDEVSHTREDQAIHDILVKIKESWERDTWSQEDDMEQTVAISKQDRRNFTETVFPSARDNEDLDETIILSAQEKSDHMGQDAEEKDQTVILPPGYFKEVSITPHQTTEDHIPETVIISSPKKPEDVSGSSKQPSKMDPDQDDLLTETVVLRPNKKTNNG